MKLKLLKKLIICLGTEKALIYLVMINHLYVPLSLQINLYIY